jgi:hypothetical protein
MNNGSDNDIFWFKSDFSIPSKNINLNDYSKLFLNDASGRSSGKSNMMMNILLNSDYNETINGVFLKDKDSNLYYPYFLRKYQNIVGDVFKDYRISKKTVIKTTINDRSAKFYKSDDVYYLDDDLDIDVTYEEEISAYGAEGWLLFNDKFIILRNYDKNYGINYVLKSESLALKFQEVAISDFDIYSPYYFSDNRIFRSTSYSDIKSSWYDSMQGP